MWVDETAAGDDPTAAGSGSEDMTVTVEGQEYSADINTDINDDGVADTAVIERPDGTTQAFVDKDGDGDADAYIKLDEQGDVIARASYNEETGEWVSAEPGGEQEGDRTQTSTDVMTADLPSGDVTVGPPTVDTNDDGVPDTAVVQGEQGNTMMFTDVDGDGDADVLVVVEPDGDYTTYEHVGENEWRQVDSGTLEQQSNLAGDSASGFAAASGSETTGGAEASGVRGWGGSESSDVSGVARIDPRTGQWISPN